MNLMGHFQIRIIEGSVNGGSDNRGSTVIVIKLLAIIMSKCNYSVCQPTKVICTQKRKKNSEGGGVKERILVTRGARVIFFTCTLSRQRRLLVWI